MALKRIKKELADINKEPHDQYSVEPIGDDFFEWQGTFNGPEGTPWEGGVFFFHVKFPADYPFKPPVVSLQTKIFHPHISRDGKICCGIYCMLKDNWSPAFTMDKAIKALIEMLVKPNMEHICDPDTHLLYTSNKEKFDETAKEWTKKYAM